MADPREDADAAVAFEESIRVRRGETVQQLEGDALSGFAVARVKHAAR
jgi:hypothetical protein